MAVRHAAGPTFEKDPTPSQKRPARTGPALILGRMRLSVPAANRDRQLIIFTDTLTKGRTHA
jgi:hypothetical protein